MRTIGNVRVAVGKREERPGEFVCRCVGEKEGIDAVAEWVPWSRESLLGFCGRARTADTAIEMRFSEDCDVWKVLEEAVTGRGEEGFDRVVKCAELDEEEAVVVLGHYNPDIDSVIATWLVTRFLLWRASKLSGTCCASRTRTHTASWTCF